MLKWVVKLIFLIGSCLSSSLIVPNSLFYSNFCLKASKANFALSAFYFAILASPENSLYFLSYNSRSVHFFSSKYLISSSLCSSKISSWTFLNPKYSKNSSSFCSNQFVRNYFTGAITPLTNRTTIIIKRFVFIFNNN